MARRTAIITGVVGALIGAGAGIPYLIRFEECTMLGTESVQCTMSQTLGPFLSAVAIGFVVAIVLGTAAAAIARRSIKPRPGPRSRPRAAVEIDDPAIQIAAWGMPPGASQRTISLSAPVARRPSRPRPARAPRAGVESRPRGAGYGAADRARAEMFAAHAIDESHPTER